MSVRIILVGGFLGSGKTTLIISAVRELLKRGYRPGVITNDQAQDLVDTKGAQDEGVPVSEVAGACFCCRFEDLVEQAELLKERCDVILAEPVGSCTDIASTVLAPLHRYHPGEFTLAPFTVLADPLRLKAVLGLHPIRLPEAVSYIYRQQLSEADIVGVNKVDDLGCEEAQKMVDNVREWLSGPEVCSLSGRHGDGLSAWLDQVLQQSAQMNTLKDIDYDQYADGEALLGWLNARSNVEGRLLDYGQHFLKLCRDSNIEVAHFKARLDGAFGYDQVNAVDSTSLVRDQCSNDVQRGILVTNARVAAEPQVLENLIKKAHREAFGAETFDEIRCFQPGRPEPTHRL